MRTNIILLALFVTCSMVSCNIVSPLILTPVRPGTDDILLILLPGALCKANQYTDLAKQIQFQSPFKLWVGIPSFFGRIPNTLQLGFRIYQIRKQVIKKGASQSLQIFVAGHSMGGVMIAAHTQKHHNNVLGQILLGSYLQRGSYALTAEGKFTLEYPIPTLTVGGEKDGLSRVSRMAQVFYRQTEYSADVAEGDAFNFYFPVVVLEGVNHMNFADGNNSFWTKKKDLQSEVTLQQAHFMIAEVMTDFMNVQYARQVSGQFTAQYQKINDYTKTSMKFFVPFIMAMDMEGSYFLKKPCFNKPNINPPNTQCTHGSPWVEIAQTLMSDLANVTQQVSVTVDDSSHRVWSVTPVHLPHIWNSCTGEVECVLNLTTVSQAHYSQFGSADNGFSLAAWEIRAKLTSRQNAYTHAGVPNPDFNQTDSGNLCGYINQKAIDWALTWIPQRTLDRYNKVGRKMVIGPDLGPFVQGNKWIKHKITYQKVTLPNGQNVLVVSSPFNATPTKYIVQQAAGFHYCKILSPLKVMEWLFGGSLEESEHV